MTFCAFKFIASLFYKGPKYLGIISRTKGLKEGKISKNLNGFSVDGWKKANLLLHKLMDIPVQTGIFAG